MDCINSKFSSLLWLEASGDSEEDGYDRVDISCMARQMDDEDDDAESCSYDTWDIMCANKYIDDDDSDGVGGHDDCVDSGGSNGHDDCVDSGGIKGHDDYGNNGNGSDVGCSHWMMGVPDIVLGSSSIEKDEEEGDVDGVTRGELDDMEDKDFWKACLATGYS